MESRAKYDFPRWPTYILVWLAIKTAEDLSSLDRSNKNLLTSRKGYLNSWPKCILSDASVLFKPLLPQPASGSHIPNARPSYYHIS